MLTEITARELEALEEVVGMYIGDEKTHCEISHAENFGSVEVWDAESQEDGDHVYYNLKIIQGIIDRIKRKQMLYQLKDAEQEDAGLVETSAPEDKVKELWKQALEDCDPLAEDYKNPVEILEELLIPEFPDSKQVFVDAEIHP